MRRSRLDQASGLTKALILLAVILVPFALLEGAARLYYRMKGESFVPTETRYTYLPNIDYFFHPFDTPYPNIGTDRHGFVHNGWDRERDLRSKEPDEFRVFVFGGSTVAGFCVPDNGQTLPARLERGLAKLFAERGLNLKPHVINAGVHAWISHHELSLATWVVRDLGPDYLLFFDGENDFHFNYDDNWKGEDIAGLLNGNYGPTAIRFHGSVNNMFSYSGVLRQIYTISIGYLASLRLIEENWRRVRDKINKESRRLKGTELEKPEVLFAPQVHRYSQNARLAAGLGHAYGAGVGIVVQPVLRQGLELTEREQGLLDHLKAASWSGHEYAAARARFVDELARSLSKLGREFDEKAVRTMVLGDVFDDKTAAEEAYCDPFHYTPWGYERIDRAMLAGLGQHMAARAEQRIQAIRP